MRTRVVDNSTGNLITIELRDNDFNDRTPKVVTFRISFSYIERSDDPNFKTAIGYQYELMDCSLEDAHIWLDQLAQTDGALPIEFIETLAAARHFLGRTFRQFHQVTDITNRSRHQSADQQRKDLQR